MYLNTNIAAMNAQRNVYQTNLALDKTLERLSSGLRINSAADDASGLAIVEKMYAQRQGTTTAIQNTQDGVALYKIAEGALNQVGKMLSRIEELTVRASNQTLTASDRGTIKDEIDQLMSQINTISTDTEYNTIKLLNGNMDIQKNLIASTGNGAVGSIRILEVEGTVKDVTSAKFTLTAIGSAAQYTGALAAAGAASTVGANTTITLNGVEISIGTSDNVESILSKINAQNSRTGVVATMSQSRFVSLVSGKVDTDAANAKTVTAASGTIVGYALVGSYNTVTGKSNQITLGGNASIWMTFLNMAATGLVASGTNAAANIDGIAMNVVASEGGNVFQMQNSGSSAYGLKVGVELSNGANGGYILNNSNAGALQASAQEVAFGRLASANDTAYITLSTASKLTLQTGANYQQNLSYSISSIDTTSIGKGASSKFGSLADIKVDTADNAALSLKVVQQAIKDVSGLRATMGAVLNRLDYTDKTLQIQNENLASAESKIRDADISLEMTTFTKQQILMQAGTSMLAQANQKPQMILSLLK
ncbi:MAG: flagellin [Candidatus Wallbacteria bacterium]